MDELDLHIIPLVLMVFILGLVIPSAFLVWPVGAIVLIPQGRIFVRAFWDYPKFGKPKAKYLFVNEVFVILSVLLFIGLKI